MPKRLKLLLYGLSAVCIFGAGNLSPSLPDLWSALASENHEPDANHEPELLPAERRALEAAVIHARLQGLHCESVAYTEFARDASEVANASSSVTPRITRSLKRLVEIFGERSAEVEDRFTRGEEELIQYPLSDLPDYFKTRQDR